MRLELTKRSIFGEDRLELCHCFYLEVGWKVELKRDGIEAILNFLDVDVFVCDFGPEWVVG
jgi:hypothetical protein